MEFIITAVVIIVLLVILGVSVPVIVQGILWIMEILLLLMTLFFIVSIVFVFLGKPRDAEFVGIDRSMKWGSAIYQVGGIQMHSTYPAEIVLQKQIYRNTSTRVRIWQRGGLYFLFDWYSILIAALGFPLSTAGAVLLGMFLLWL